LIPADGFYEWTGEKGRKQPFFITLGDEKPFAGMTRAAFSLNLSYFAG